jgi:hypothetical protein
VNDDTNETKLIKIPGLNSLTISLAFVSSSKLQVFINLPSIFDLSISVLEMKHCFSFCFIM